MARTAHVPATVAPAESASRRTSGLAAIYWKEIGDYVSGYRFFILFVLIIVASLAALYVGGQTLRDTLTQAGETDRFVFLRLFTSGSTSLPPFVFFVGFLGPLLGIALGFDAINGERNRGTLSRLVSQPIYRDAIINGKFLAGLTVVAAMIGALGFLVGGIGLRMIGIPPTAEELARLGVFWAVTVLYVGFWMSLAILFSTLFRQTVASALASLGVWLFFSLFAGLLFGLLADAVAPVTDPLSGEQVLRHAQWANNLNRLSPALLYEEAIQTVLNPHLRTLGPLRIDQVIGAIPGPLPLGQSLLLIWPHLTCLFGLMVVCFVLAYVTFMRQEIRPW